MPRRTIQLLAIGLLLLTALTALPAAAQDWAGRGRLQGVVLDENGEPIPGATVSVHFEKEEGPGPEPFTTNKKGRFSYLGLKTGSWTILVDAPGYKTSVGSVRVNEFARAETHRIEMTPNPYSAIDSGDELMEAGDYEAARAAYHEAMVGLPEDRQARLRSRIGDTYLEEGRYGEAREEYRAALPELGEGEKVHIRLRVGDSYFQEGEYDEARAAYREVMADLEPAEQAQIQLKIAQSYGLEENTAAAIEALEKAHELAPESSEIIQLLADLLSREGRDDEAQAYLAKLPEGTRLPPDMLMNLGIRLYNEGDLDGALTQFDRAVAENPDLPEAYYYRGLVHLAKGNNDEARTDLEKMLELAPEHEKAAEVEEYLSYLRDQG